jgi:hypothetical protein
MKEWWQLIPKRHQAACPEPTDGSVCYREFLSPWSDSSRVAQCYLWPLPVKTVKVKSNQVFMSNFHLLEIWWVKGHKLNDLIKTSTEKCKCVIFSETTDSGPSIIQCNEKNIAKNEKKSIHSILNEIQRT